MRRLRAFSWIFGAALLLTGVALRPAPVEVALQAPNHPSTVYWTGRLSEPAIRSGVHFQSLLVNHYPLPLDAPPERVRFQVSFRMHLVTADPGLYRFELDSPWHGDLEVDGKQIFESGRGEVLLGPGLHRLDLLVRPTREGMDGGIRLLWRTPTRALRVLTTDDLTIPESPRLFVLGAVAASPLLWLGGFILVFLSLRATLEQRTRASARVRILAAAGLAFLALATRSAHFAEFPHFGGDEIHNAWAGFNLLHEGRPKTWSRLPVYIRETTIDYFGRSFPIVESAFDHTPLVPIVAGASATLFGAKHMFECTPARIRPPMILAGTMSVVVLFFLALKLFGFRAGFLAALFMAVSPLATLNSRLVKEEGLVQLFWLLGALLYARAAEKRDSPRLDYLCGALFGLAALSKIHGVALGGAFAAAAMASPVPNWKRALRLATSSLAVAALYPLYGLLLDARTYLSVVTWLGGRYPYAGEDFAEKFLILPRFILEPKASAGLDLIDGWILLGWLSLPFLARSLPTVIPLAAYLLALMATIHSGNLYGFYVIPVLPFLCLAAGRMAERTLSRPAFLTSFLLAGLLFLPHFARAPFAPYLGFRGLILIAAVPLALHVFRAVPRIAALEARTLEVLLALAVVAGAHQSLSTF
jgi:hypothetical protein